MIKIVSLQATRSIVSLVLLICLWCTHTWNDVKTDDQ